LELIEVFMHLNFSMLGYGICPVLLSRHFVSLVQILPLFRSGFRIRPYSPNSCKKTDQMAHKSPSGGSFVYYALWDTRNQGKSRCFVMKELNNSIDNRLTDNLISGVKMV